MALPTSSTPSTLDWKAASEQYNLVQEAQEQVESASASLHEALTAVLGILDVGDIHQAWQPTPFFAEGQAFMVLWNHKRQNGTDTAVKTIVDAVEKTLLDG